MNLASAFRIGANPTLPLSHGHTAIPFWLALKPQDGIGSCRFLVVRLEVNDPRLLPTGSSTRRVEILPVSVAYLDKICIPASYRKRPVWPSCEPDDLCRIAALVIS